MQRAIRITAMAVLVTVLLMFGGFVLLLQNKQMKDNIPSINTCARFHYQNFTNGFIDLEKYTDIPSEGDYIVFGECYDFTYYTAYEGDLLAQDIVFLEYAYEKPDDYWAIRIHDGVITEAWSANYPLEESQLRPYSEEEQYQQMRLFEKFSESRAIGYYTISAE